MPLGNSVATVSSHSQMRRRSSTRRFSWGIFTVSYSDPGRTSSFRMKGITMSWQPFISTIRLIVDLIVIAPRPFAFLALGSLWLSTSPALSLYLSFVVLEAVHSSVIHQIDVHNRCNLFIFVWAWLGTAILSSFVDHLLDENKLVLGAHLRAHFLPELATARLRLDITHPDYHRLRTSLPNPWGFSEGAPALNFVLELSSRIRTVLTISFELFVLIHIVAMNNGPDAFILRSIGILFLIVVYWAPSNGLGGAGYTFWTKNKNYHKLCGLHAMIFQDKYSETLTKDGVGERICREYKNTSDALGIAKCDTFALACHLPPPWYWMLARAMIIDYPMALYALALPWSLSSRSLVNMALVQHGTTILGQSIDAFKRYRDPSPLMIQVQRFYETLDYQGENDHHGNVPYPSPSSSRRGMKLSFKNVSCILTSSTGGSGVLAVNNASFSIEPGQLVVIVGGNGSGKTSLLKLIARLNEVSCGELLIDDVSVRDYDINDLRRSMAFLTQTEEVYPVSLSDNLVMGLPELPRGGRDVREVIDEAAQLGGSYDLFQRLGYDTILDPPRVVGQSLKGCGNGEIGKEAIEELERHTAGMKEITISCGEKQRLVASRTFLRVKNSDIKLLVVDEPTSALDPVAERDLFEHFLGLRNGKTVICVTHRFGNIVKHADLILCMKGGQIVQKGTHEKLMAEEGEYKRLYTAQAE